MSRGRTPLTKDQFTDADFEAAKARARHRRPAEEHPVEGQPLRVAGARGAHREAVRGRGDVHRDRGGRPRHHEHPRLADAADRREVGQGGGDRPAREGPRGGRRGDQDPLPAVDGEPARQEAAQRRAHRAGLPDRRHRCLRRVRRRERDQGDQAVPAAVRRPRRRLAAARVRVQADRLRHRHRGQADHRRDDVHGRRDRLRRQLHADRRRQPRARPRPRPRRPPVLAQHPGRQGDRDDRQRQRPDPGRGDGHPVPQRRGRCGPVVRAGRRGGPSQGPRAGVRRPRRPRPARGADDAAQGHRLRGRDGRGRGDPAGARAGHGRGRGRDRHRHPGRQHRPPGEPVLGRVPDPRRR